MSERSTTCFFVKGGQFASELGGLFGQNFHTSEVNNY